MELKEKYEEFLNLLVRAFYSNTEIVIIDFLIRKSQEDDSEVYEELIEEALNFSKNHTRESLKQLEKGKIVENREGRAMGPLGKFRNTSFWRINRNLADDIIDNLETFESVIQNSFMKKRTLMIFSCIRCKETFRPEEVFMSGGSTCPKSSCRGALMEQRKSKEEIEQIDDDNTISKSILIYLQEKCKALLGKQWPFGLKLYNSLRNDGQTRDGDGQNENYNGNGDKDSDDEVIEGCKSFESFKIFAFNKFFKKRIKIQELLQKRENFKLLKNFSSSKDQTSQKMTRNRISKEKYEIAIKNREKYRSLKPEEYQRLFKKLSLENSAF